MSQRITAKQLREERAQVIAKGRAVLDKAEAEGRDLTAEERLEYARLCGDVRRDDKGNVVNGADGKPERVIGEEERLKVRIEQLEKQEGLETDLAAPARRIEPQLDTDNRSRPAGPTEEQRSLALQAWCRSQTGLELKPEHEEACRAVGLNPRTRDLALNLRTDDYRKVRSDCRRAMAGEWEQRALSVLVPSSGGYTIPEGFQNSLEVALLQYGGIRDVATVMRTATGNDLPWPTVNDTANKGAILQENTTVTPQDMPFGAVVYHAYKYTSKLVLVPVELLEDSAFNLATTLGELLGIRIGRIQADHFTTGTGAAQPTGLITAATSGVTAAADNAVAADDLYTLKHSVDPAYRKGASWQMHDQVLLAVKKLKDGLGRYLWQASLAGSRPDTLDGDPISINQSMDSTLASGKKPFVYGLLSKYMIRDVAEVRLRRLVERYADADQEGFVMFMRGDGNLLDAGTHPVKYMVQP